MRRNAFTLVELLVVIGIVAVLIGITIPALSGARVAARASACLSNVRQLQLASLMYSLERGGALIEPGLDEGGFVNEEVAWINTLRSYADDRLTVVSPGDGSPHWPSEEGGAGLPVEGTSDRFRRTSYGVNNYVTRFLPVELSQGATTRTVADSLYTNLNKIIQPASIVQFLFMAERGQYAGADHVHVEQWWFKRAPDASPELAARQVNIGAYGGGEASWNSRSTWGFLDGHAELLTFREVYQNPEKNKLDPRLQR